MKRLIVFLFLLAPLTAFCQPRLDIDLDSTLKGPIKSITERQYDSGDLENSRWGYIYNYDHSQKLVEEHQYDFQSKEYHLKKKFEYDSDGRKLALSNYGRKGELYLKDSFVYNPEGILIKKYEISYNGSNDPLIKLDEYEVNTAGQIVKHFITDGNNDKKLVSSSSYYPSGRLLSTVTETLWDTTIVEYNYDNDGRIWRKEIFHLEKGAMSDPCTDEYTYSADSMIKIDQGCKGGLVEVKKMDQKGRVIYESWDYTRRSGKRDYYTIHSTYDDHGLIVKEEWEDNRNPEKEVITYTKYFEFEYDDHGNWIKLTRRRIENDVEEIFMIFERDITYYE